MQDNRYTIQRGDTLWDLSRRLGTTVDELMRLNPQIQNRNKILAGAKMTLPQASPAPQTAAEGASPTTRREQVGGSSPISPLKEMGISASGTPLEGLVTPSQFPGAVATAPAMNPVQQDAFRSQQGMEATPELAALQAMGAASMIPAMGKAIPALARMAPTTATPGVLGNAMKGAVNWPGAAPSISNVAPVMPNNPGAAQALAQAMLARRAAMQPQAGQTLLDGARMPSFGSGTGIPANSPTWSMILGGN